MSFNHINATTANILMLLPLFVPFIRLLGSPSPCLRLRFFSLCPRLSQFITEGHKHDRTHNSRTLWLHKLHVSAGVFRLWFLCIVVMSCKSWRHCGGFYRQKKTSHIAAHSLFTRQPLLKLHPLLLQLAEAFSQTRELLPFLCVCSHGDRCLCCHGKPQNLRGRGLDLPIQSAAELCRLGGSSAVLQPLIGWERSRTVMKQRRVTGDSTWTMSQSFLSPSPPPTASSTASVYSTLCNLGHTHTFCHHDSSNYST